MDDVGKVEVRSSFIFVLFPVSPRLLLIPRPDTDSLRVEVAACWVEELRSCDVGDVDVRSSFVFVDLPVCEVSKLLRLLLIARPDTDSLRVEVAACWLEELRSCDDVGMVEVLSLSSFVLVNFPVSLRLEEVR